MSTEGQVCQPSGEQTASFSPTTIHPLLLPSVSENQLANIVFSVTW